MELSIAHAAESDHGELFELYAAVVEDGGAFPRRPPADEPMFREAWLDGKTVVYVARTGAQLAGSYYLAPNFHGDAGHIANAGYMVRRDSAVRGSAGVSWSTPSPRRRRSASTR